MTKVATAKYALGLFLLGCTCVSWSTAPWFRGFFLTGNNCQKIIHVHYLEFRFLFIILHSSKGHLCNILDAWSQLWFSISSCLEWKCLKIWYSYKWVTYNNILNLKIVSCHELLANFWILFSWHRAEMKMNTLPGWRVSILIFWVNQVTFLTEKEIRYGSN